MSTFDLSTGYAGGTSFEALTKRRTEKMEVAIPLTGVTSDIVKTMPIKAGTLVHGIKLVVTSLATATTITMDIGVADTAVTGYDIDGFDASVSGTAAVGTVTRSVPADAYPVIGGFYFVADGTIDITLSTITAMTVAPTFDLFVDCEDLS